MSVWPRSGQPKRIYLNSGGRWSVDTWLEPISQEPGWKLQIRIKDGEAVARRIELYADIEDFVFGLLTEALVHASTPLTVETASWSDWLALAKQRY